jgi:hypothetical protein
LAKHYSKIKHIVNDGFFFGAFFAVLAATVCTEVKPSFTGQMIGLGFF